MSVLVDLTQGGAEWIQWRRHGLGGSDAPVVEGLSPYRTPRDLYFEKTGIAKEDDSSNEFIFARGHEVETLIRTEFQKLIKADMQPVCMQHDEIDFLRASLDGFHPTFGVLEAKLVGQDVIKEAKSGRIPAHHYSQMQHQFAVSGADVGQWFGHDGKKSGAVLEVRANPEYIKRLTEKEISFWESVQRREAPPLTNEDYLEPTDVTALQELRDAKEAAEMAQLYYEQLKTKCVEMYKHPKIRGAGIRLYRVERQGALSLPKIPEIAAVIEAKKADLAPAYIESFRSKPVESWTIQIEKPKKVTP